MFSLLLVPTFRVGTKSGRSASRKFGGPALSTTRDARRPDVGSHAERGNQESLTYFVGP